MAPKIVRVNREQYEAQKADSVIHTRNPEGFRYTSYQTWSYVTMMPMQLIIVTVLCADRVKHSEVKLI